MPAMSRADLLDPTKGGYNDNRLLAMLIRGEYPDGTPIVGTVDGLEGAWRGEFAGANGAAPDAARWTILRAAGANVPTLDGSSHVNIPTGTVSGEETELISKYIFQAPARVQFGLDNISQRIAGQEFSLEVVEVDQVTGLPVQGADAGDNRVGMFLTGTTATGGLRVATWSSGDNGQLTGQTIPISTANPAIYEIDFQPDDLYFYVGNVDSTKARLSSWHLNRKVPDPQAWYAVRIRAKNTATAASSTVLSVDHVLIENGTFLPVEIARSRGASAAVEQLPVNGQINVTPRSDGGLLAAHNAAVTNADANVIAAPHNLYGFAVTNTGGATAFLKFYNKVSAVVVGTDTPVFVIGIPAGQTITHEFVNGIQFLTGIRMAATALATDADATAPAAALAVTALYG